MANSRRQDLIAAMMVAIGVRGMKWLGRLGFRLQRIGQASVTDVGEYVALLLSIPCFNLGYAFGLLAFHGHQRNLRLLGCDQEVKRFDALSAKLHALS
jgi:hypothetical protein